MDVLLSAKDAADQSLFTICQLEFRLVLTLKGMVGTIQLLSDRREGQYGWPFEHDVRSNLTLIMISLLQPRHSMRDADLAVNQVSSCCQMKFYILACDFIVCFCCWLVLIRPSITSSGFNPPTALFNHAVLTRSVLLSQPVMSRTPNVKLFFSRDVS